MVLTENMVLKRNHVFFAGRSRRAVGKSRRCILRKEEFYFDSRDGKSKIHAVKYLPEEKPVCIFQIIHGM